MSEKYPFLDLLEKKLDDLQSIALETTKNAVIAAGAGSGKTQVLATRFAWLVLTKQAKADEILTLTFTNKAAAEMYQRIYATLNFFASHEVCPELSQQQIDLAKEGLSDFANAHIQTLDSYCANIVRQCSNRYGISPDFSTGSGDGVRDVKNAALKFTLKNASQLGIKTFSEPGKLQDFAEKQMAYTINQFTNLTTPAGFFSSKLDIQLQELITAINFYCSESQKTDSHFYGENNLLKYEDAINSEFEVSFKPTQKEYKGLIDQAFDFARDGLIGQTYEISDITDKTEKITNAASQYQNFKTLINKAGGMSAGWNKNVRSIISQLRGKLLPVLDAIFAYANQYDALVSFYSLMDQFMADVNESKRSSGNLSFGDVSQLALKILIENQDIREQEIAAYKKIMIDEFQDNNGENRDMLYLLSLKPGTKIDCNIQDFPVYHQIIKKDQDGNIEEDLRQPEKLFFVGDEKQSIYKFRGADVSVFNELTSHNENLMVPMNYNYRSDDETVQSFNVIFHNGSGIFTNPEINPADYEAYYKDAKKFSPAQREEILLPELTAANVPIHIRFSDSNRISTENENVENAAAKLLPAEEQEAYYIAKQIYEMSRENKNYSDFAVLDRSRTHRKALTKYLSLFKLPYQLDQFNNIFEDGIVNDFYNFFRICVYPSDINAYAAYLCSPLAGLSENSVELILSHLVDSANYDFVFDPFLDMDNEIKNDLNTVEFEKYQAARDFYKENKSLVLQQKLTSTLNLLWHKRAYKYESILTSQTDLNAEQFDMIFELARSSDEGGKSAAWFIDQLDILKSSLSKEDADIDAADISYPLERSEAVQVMTIHKSKGLQFKHVFLCGCTNVNSKAEKSLVFYDKKTGVSVKAEKGSPNYFSLVQSELEKKKEIAEFRRLIYVGITRAINDVYITGTWNTKPDESYEKKSDLRIFERYVENLYKADIADDLQYEAGYPFDFKHIIPVNYAAVSHPDAKVSSDQLRAEKMAVLKDAYQKAENLVYESHPLARNTPSGLEDSQFEGGLAGSLQGEKTALSEDALMDLARQTAGDDAPLQAPGFTAADFGTLVHSYLEAQVNGIAPEAFQPAQQLLHGLDSESECNKVLDQCIAFAKLFTETAAGQELTSAQEAGRFYRAEWAFKMYWQETLWTGSIDLIYQKADGSYQIIDYKSDSQVDVEKYRRQQDCYRVAAAKMLGVPKDKIDCKLWFMKTNQFISV